MGFVEILERDRIGRQIENDVNRHKFNKDLIVIATLSGPAACRRREMP